MRGGRIYFHRLPNVSGPNTPIPGPFVVWARKRPRLRGGAVWTSSFLATGTPAPVYVVGLNLDPWTVALIGNDVDPLDVDQYQVVLVPNDSDPADVDFSQVVVI